MTPALLTAIAFLSGASPADARTLSGDALVDHARALAADDACGLFSEARRRALEAGLRQIRDDLETAGAAGAAVDAALARARGDRTLLDCRSDAVRRIAADVEARLEPYDRLHQLTFEGRRRAWSARRLPAGATGWAVRQESGDLHFGWRVGVDGPRVVIAVADGPPPAAAVLILRDRARATAPVDATAGGLLAPAGGPLASWGPPRDAETRIWSTGPVKIADAATDAAATGYAIGFPDDALARIAALAPREGVRVELKNGSGRTYRTAWLEVGALRAALDFVTAER